MNSKRAFTLIELLVVIAIIAILAAILFPVFAQAKFAAKSSAALSNTKQLSLAVLMYENDYDDNFPLGTAWNTGHDQLGWSGGPHFSTWGWSCAPYIKNAQIFLDPTTNPNPANLTPALNWDTFYTQFGYNYSFLSPLTGTASAQRPEGQSTSIGQNPSQTVMIASKWTQFDNHTPYVWGTGFPDGNGNGAQGMLADAAIDAPNCYTLNTWCLDDWGKGDFWDLTSNGGLLGVPLTEGGETGGNAFRGGRMVTVGWVDGHAKAVAYDALAKGTNFSLNNANGATGGHGNITITKIGDYPFSLSKSCSDFAPGAGGRCNQ